VRLPRPVVDGSRKALRRLAQSDPARRAMLRAARELTNAVDDMYGDRYYGCGAKNTAAGRVSGYESYDRQSSNADVAAYMLWRHFPMRRTLDVGCALGFVVEALREVGVEAHGVDVSQFAVDHAAPGARGFLQRGDLGSGLPFPDGHFDLVSALEILEHLEPGNVAAALRELRRLTSAYAVVTTPSFGPNEAGPAGWFEGKVRDDRLEHYKSLGPSYEGPVANEDLMRDTDGNPIEGHLTIASFSWWTQRFAAVGLVRDLDTERRIHPLIERFGLLPYWNLYVLRVAGASPPSDKLRGDADIARIEERWGLSTR
jgi:SAM-dependent methyltransferase